MLEIEYKNQRFSTPVDMFLLKDVFPPHHKVYAANLIKDVTVLGIKKDVYNLSKQNLNMLNYFNTQIL